MMSYYSLTRSTANPLEQYTRYHFGGSEFNTEKMEKWVLARGAHAFLIPLSFLTNVLDTIIGVGASIGAASHLICGGRDWNVWSRCTNNHLPSCARILAQPYANFILTLNPTLPYKTMRTFSYAFDPDISFTGFAKDHLHEWTKAFLEGCKASKSPLKFWAISRLTHGLLGLAYAITRVADAIICLPAAAAALLFRGNKKTLNQLALGTLQAPAIVGDLIFTTLKIIRPYETEFFEVPIMV